jgi:hypothetical protein
MTTPAIVPTITQRVRTFLADQGAELRPWSGLQETYDELYGLLRQRRRDPEFWQPLKGLLQEVVASAADSQRCGRGTSAQAELLASWKVDELVDDLRDALPDDASSARTDFTRSLSTAVLGGFLLLGLAAAGCAGGDSEQKITAGTGGALGTGGRVTIVTGTGGSMGTGGESGAGGASGTTTTLPGTGGSGPGGTGGAVGTGGRASGGAGGMAAGGAGGSTGSNPLDGGADVGADVALDSADAAGLDVGAVDVAKAETMGIDAAPPACAQTMAPELDRAIGQSSLTANQKNQLCACFSALGAEWTTSLTQLFATSTPEQISAMLSGLTSCCSSDGIHNRYGTIASPSPSDLSTIKNGMGYSFCAAPVYKGVSFPET